MSELGVPAQNVLRVEVAEFGSAVSTRDEGRVIAYQIGDQLDQNAQALTTDLNFHRVEAMNIGATDEIVCGFLVRQFFDGRKTALLSDMSESIVETIEVALQRRKMLCAQLGRGTLNLMGDVPSFIQETFDYATQHEEFEINEMARMLNVSAPAANNRVKTLVDSGVLFRNHAAGKGRRFSYRLPKIGK